MSNKQPISMFLGIAAGLVLATNGAAGIINVPGDQPTIQAGIDVAVDGDHVIVAPGTYTVTRIDVNKDISLLGSGALVTIVESQLDQGQTLLNICFDPPVSPIVDGFTFKAGPRMADICIYAAPEFRNCTFTELPRFPGEGLIVDGGATPRFMNCTFQGLGTGGFAVNVSDGGNDGTSATFIGCLFIDNVTSALAVRAFATATVVDCVFFNNCSDLFGGAISNQGNVTAINCLFLANEALFGGAISTEKIRFRRRPPSSTARSPITPLRTEVVSW